MIALFCGLIGWLVLGFFVAYYYIRTRDFSGELKLRGWVMLILTLAGPLSFAMFAGEFPKVRPFQWKNNN